MSVWFLGPVNIDPLNSQEILQTREKMSRVKHLSSIGGIMLLKILSFDMLECKIQLLSMDKLAAGGPGDLG